MGLLMLEWVVLFLELETMLRRKINRLKIKEISRKRANKRVRIRVNRKINKKHLRRSDNML